jgi:hypothetical protein
MSLRYLIQMMWVIPVPALRESTCIVPATFSIFADTDATVARTDSIE